MEKKLTICQQYMLEQALFSIGTQPYIMMCSDDSDVLNNCMEEMLKRIEYIKCVSDYPRGAIEFTIPDWLNEILTVEYKSIILMDFDKRMEEKINSNPEMYNEEFLEANVYPSTTVDEYAAWRELVYFRDYLCGYSIPDSIRVISSIIVFCSNKFKNVGVADLRDFINVYCLDDTKSHCFGVDEEEIKIRIKRLRQIDYNARHKDRIQKYNGVS